MSSKPVCVVVLAYFETAGVRPDATFHLEPLYQQGIKPAVEAAGFVPLCLVPPGGLWPANVGRLLDQPVGRVSAA